MEIKKIPGFGKKKNEFKTKINLIGESKTGKTTLCNKIKGIK
jgi:GTPase SAR1 family protein